MHLVQPRLVPVALVAGMTTLITGGQRHGHEARLDEVHVGVNPAGVAMYARS